MLLYLNLDLNLASSKLFKDSNIVKTDMAKSTPLYKKLFFEIKKKKPQIIKEIDCNKIKVQPNFEIPYLDVVDVISGGDLTAGTYQFAVQYCDAAGDAYTAFLNKEIPVVNGVIKDIGL